MSGTEHTESSAGFTELVAQVAASLGEPWRLDDDPEWAEHHGRQLIGPDVDGHPARLFFYSPWNRRERIAIHGSYPRDAALHSRAAVRTEITVSRERGPAAIAREITRRLLPTYLVALSAVAAALAADDAAQQARHAAATRLAALLGGEADSPHRDRREDRVRVHLANAFGHVAVSYDATQVRIELHAVPVAAAEAMLAALVVTDQPGAGTERDAASATTSALARS